jgi:hypothetical protein
VVNSINYNASPGESSSSWFMQRVRVLRPKNTKKTEGKKSRTGSTFKTKVETTKGAVVNMESTYYNVVAPASYGGLSKFKPKG